MKLHGKFDGKTTYQVLEYLFRINISTKRIKNLSKNKSLQLQRILKEKLKSIGFKKMPQDICKLKINLPF